MYSVINYDPDAFKVSYTKDSSLPEPFLLFEIKWYTSVQINHQPDATIFQFIILTFIYSSTSYGRFSAHHQELNNCSGSLWFYLRIVVKAVLYSWSGRDNKLKNCCIRLVIYLN
jgi:hypothetical protein